MNPTIGVIQIGNSNSTLALNTYDYKFFFCLDIGLWVLCGWAEINLLEPICADRKLIFYH